VFGSTPKLTAESVAPADSSGFLPLVDVSALVSTYASQRFIRGCLEDLIGQTLFEKGRLEIIVVDSASPQQEGSIVREFQARHPNITYLRTGQRETVYQAWNHGIRSARGRYLTNANTDDRHRRDALERMCGVLEQRPEIALVYADVWKTKTPNETFDRCTPTGCYRWYDWNRQVLLTKGCFIGPQPMWRKSVHELYGGFDGSLVTSGDFEFWLRISQTLDFHHLREPLGLYLVNSESVEHRSRDLKSAEDARILGLYHTAAAQREIIRCAPLEELKALPQTIPSASKRRAEEIIAELEKLAGLHPDGVEAFAACPKPELSRFFTLKRQILCSAATPERLQEFIRLVSLRILNRTRWFARYHKFLEAGYQCAGAGSVDAAGPCLRRLAVHRLIQVPEFQNKTGGYRMNPAESMYEVFQPLLQKCRPQELIDVLERVIWALPDFARAHNDLGVQYYRREEKQAAREHYEKAVGLEPQNVVFLKNLADFYFVEEQRVEDALRLYVRTLEIDPRDVETLTVTGHICVSQKKFEDAKLFYERVLELEPWSAEVRANLDKLNAITAATGVVRQPQELYAEAVRLASDGNGPAAMRLLEQALQVDPRFGLAHNDLGVLCFNAGDQSAALRHYEEAVRLEPENLTFKKNLADFYYVAQQRIEDALRIYVDILENNPEDVEALMATAQVCVTLEQADDAKLFYERVLAIEPWNAEAAHAMDVLAQGGGLPPPQDAGSIHAEAGRLAAAGDVQGAVETLKGLAAAFPDFALGHNDLAVLCCRVGDVDAALKHYEQAVRLEPANTTFKKNLADFCWVKLGRVRDALEQYVDVLAVEPHDVETLLATGRICVALKQFEDARDFFERVLEIEPWNSGAHQLIGEVGELSRAAA
jgi:tetratricopeptide (TPR) repeat protein